VTVRVRILAGAGPDTGLGHVTRCHALAEALRTQGADVTLETADPEWVEGAIGLETEPFGTRPVDLIVLDRYGTSAQERADLKAQCRKLAVIDDHFAPPSEADIVINHNLYGDPDRYDAFPGIQVLAGTDYTLLRPGFEALRSRPAPSEARILVALGGGAYAAKGINIANMLRSTFQTGVDLVLNASMAKDASGVNAGVRIVSGNDALDAMAGATVYVGGLGVAMIEARALGLFLIGIPTAANQDFAVDWAKANGFPVLTGIPESDAEFRALADAVRTGLSRGRDLPAKPDGTGAATTASALLHEVS